MELLPHIAFVLVAVSFAVRDIIWLRSLAIAASVVAIGYEWAQWATGEPFRAANLMWHSLFALINAYWVWVLVYVERHVQLDEEERILFEGPFRGLTRLEFAKLRNIARWQDVPAGTVLARQDEPLADLALVYSGLADVEVDGRHKTNTRTGQLIGEMSYVSGGAAAATVRAKSPMRLLVWSKKELDRLLHRNPSLRLGLTAVMGRDMSAKLREDDG